MCKTFHVIRCRHPCILYTAPLHRKASHLPPYMLLIKMLMRVSFFSGRNNAKSSWHQSLVSNVVVVYRKRSESCREKLNSFSLDQWHVYYFWTYCFVVWRHEMERALITVTQVFTIYLSWNHKNLIVWLSFEWIFSLRLPQCFWLGLGKSLFSAWTRSGWK